MKKKKSPMKKVRKPIAPPTKVIPNKKKKNIEYGDVEYSSFINKPENYQLVWSEEDQDYLIQRR